VRRGVELRRFESEASGSGFALSPDTKLLAVGGEEGVVELWDVAKGVVSHKTSGHKGLYSARLQPGREALGGRRGSETVTLWDVSSGRSIASLNGHAKEIISIAFSPDGKVVAATEINGVYPPGITLYDPATGRDLATFEGHQDTVNSLTFSRDGALLASVTV
jgi:WD40 repeat protein